MPDKKIPLIFYGDSNTYGYDPADLYENRYPVFQRWTTMVSEAVSDDFEIFPEGMNGRKLPDMRLEQPFLQSLIDRIKDGGILCTMLGTNDLLCRTRPDADIPIGWMERYLDHLRQYLTPRQILIIAPPLVGTPEETDAYVRACRSENRRMNDAFKVLAQQCGASFADASAWGIELSPDMVHFSEAGHRTFAQEMIRLLEEIRQWWEI